jgi:protein SCO1/2
MRRRRLVRPAGCALLLLTLAACAPRRRAEGIVLRVDPARARALIAHKAIEGYMPAMTMEFEPRRPADFAPLRPGSRVEFDLKNGRAHRVKVIRSGFDPREVDLSQAPPLPEPGQTVADFELTDQEGRPRRLSDFRGKLVAVNFIYTRCPMPEVCPRLTASFASLQRRFAGRPLELLSITLDPLYDTPPVLAAYARANGARWTFLTGETAPVARQFGMFYWAEEGVLVHNSATALIDPRGRLAAVVEGSNYRLEQLSALVRYHLDKEFPQ